MVLQAVNYTGYRLQRRTLLTLDRPCSLKTRLDIVPISPLHDPVTWYGINYAATQGTQCDFQNKRTRTSLARLFFVLKVPLRPSIIYSVPCDRIVQRAYYNDSVAVGVYDVNIVFALFVCLSGALTKGDRRAATGADLTQFNFDTPYGRSALRNMYQSVTLVCFVVCYQEETIFCPFV